MSSSNYVLALLRSHLDGNEDQFFSVAMQIAAGEARLGHTRVAQELRDLIDLAKTRSRTVSMSRGPVPVAQPKGDLAALLSVSYSDTRLANMTLPDALRARLERVLLEQRQQEHLLEHDLSPRKKLLLLGPPGSGKTMTAAALAGELELPLLTIRLDGVLTRFMGETASKLRLIFDAMYTTRGVYLFDEFDAIGSRRDASNDVGEVRRILNSFLQFLEGDESQSVVVAATNHPELLDVALFRRFDDVLEYALPDPGVAILILRSRLAMFDLHDAEWAVIARSSEGLSQAELVRAADEAAKVALLDGRRSIAQQDLISALAERRSSRR